MGERVFFVIGKDLALTYLIYISVILWLVNPAIQRLLLINNHWCSLRALVYGEKY